jgi:hypothetical protein
VEQFLVDRQGDAPALRFIERCAHYQFQHDVLQTGLDHLELPNLGDGHQVAPDIGEAGIAVGQVDQCLDPAPDPAQHRQAAPAGAGFAHLHDVPELIADERCGVVQQGGRHHPPRLAGPAGSVPIVQHLHQDVLGLHVQVLGFWALVGDGVEFFGTVVVDHGHVPDFPAELTQPRVQRLCVGPDLAQIFRLATGLGRQLDQAQDR